MKKIVMMLVVGVVVWGAGSSQAGYYVGDVFEVSTASGDQTRPDISGDNVVWIDHRTTDYNVRLKNLSTSNETVISTSRTHTNYGTAIDGNIVTWADNRSGVDHWYDIYGYDISTSTEFLISPQGDYRLQPDINSDIVVWWENAAGDDNYDIYGYDLSTETRFPVCTDTRMQIRPATNGNIVVWQDERNGNRVNYDIYGYDISTQTEFPICRVNGEQQFPAISENFVVWRDQRNGWRDIYGYDIATQTEFPICTDDSWQDFPAISENFVVWQDVRNGDWDIYGYDLLTQTEFPIATGLGDQVYPAISGNTVVWESGGDIYGAEILKSPTPVVLDIKPGSCPNPLNVKSKGVLPIAILGTEEFDVATIDPVSVRLAGAMPIRSGYEDVATPVADPDICECTTDGPDGFTDLILKFKTQDIVEALGAVDDGEMIELLLTGVLFDETPIEGADCIIIRGKTQPAEKGKSKK